MVHHAGPGRMQKAANQELLLHFLFVWAQTLQDGRTLYSKKILCFLFSILTVFWRENDVTRLTAKLKFQDMAKQTQNFERTWRDRNKCEKNFSKTQLVKELLSFEFWIFRHFVTIFRNIRTFQDAISPKAIELSQEKLAGLRKTQETLLCISLKSESWNDSRKFQTTWKPSSKPT